MSLGAAEPILLTQTRLIWLGSPLTPGSGNLKHAFDFFDFPPQGYPNPEGEMHMSHESGGCRAHSLNTDKIQAQADLAWQPLETRFREPETPF